MGAIKRVGDACALTVRWWEGATLPRAGDALRTTTGRTYLILAVRPAAPARPKVLSCVVVPKDASIAGVVFDWRWAKRGRKG